MFTVTEFRQRLRPLARQCAAMEGLLPGEFKIELDERLVPVYWPVLPFWESDLVAQGDDLAGHLRVSDSKATLDRAGLLGHGAVVHVRVYDTGEWGELRNVFMVWMGTPEQDARIVSAPALRTYEDLLLDFVIANADWSEFTQGEALPPADDAYERFTEERDAGMLG